MPFPLFDRSRLRIQPLARRHNDLDLSVLLPLGTEPPAYDHPALPVLGRRLVEARRQGRAASSSWGRTSSAQASPDTSST